MVIELVEQILPVRPTMEKGGDSIRHGKWCRNLLWNTVKRGDRLALRLGLGTHDVTKSHIRSPSCQDANSL